jgi:hypothetical protein
MRGEEHRRERKPTVAAAVCLSLFGLVAQHVAAQGCAMCYQTAAAAGAPGRGSLRHGILVLLVPAICLFLGILAFIYRRNNLPR